MCVHAEVLTMVATAAERAVATGEGPSPGLAAMSEALHALAEAVNDRDTRPCLSAADFAVLSKLCALALTMPTSAAGLIKYKDDIEKAGNEAFALLMHWKIC